MRSMAGVVLATASLSALVAACSVVRGGGGRADELALGREVFTETCAVCHSVSPPAVAAPPMSHVARHYLEELPDTTAAVRRIAEWIGTPSAEASLLPAHAVERWGLMPPLQLTEPRRRAVAAYVVTLASEGQTPGGMGMGMGAQHRHGQEQQVTPAVEEAVARVAEPAAAALRTGLAQRLTAAVQAGGPEHAIDVCAAEALVLTDSIAGELGGGIALKRTSSRLRNPRNAPDALEAEALRWFEAEAAAGRQPERLVQAAGADAYRYYVPLRVVALCVNCHGPEESLTPGVRSVLRQRYPADRATGYVAGDVRGLLRVSVPAAAVRHHQD